MSENEGHLHHAQLANLAAMARSIFQQVGATEVAQPELMTLAGFNGTNGAYPAGSLIADAHGDLFGTTQLGGAYDLGTVLEIAKTANGYASSPTTPGRELCRGPRIGSAGGRGCSRPPAGPAICTSMHTVLGPVTLLLN
jgi:hypothetical protein